MIKTKNVRWHQCLRKHVQYSTNVKYIYIKYNLMDEVQFLLQMLVTHK